MMQDGSNGSFVSHAVTNSYWFKRFMSGCHRHMGDVWLPDKVVSRYIIVACFCVLEKDWNDIWEHYKEGYFALHWLAKASCVIIAGIFGGLQGEEINKIDLTVTRKY